MEQFLIKLPFWEKLTAEEKEMVIARSSIEKFDKGQDISSTSCKSMVFVIKGGMRVCLLSDEGREITLYRVPENDCCVTTASCVIHQITFETVVSASEETSLLIIPSAVCSYLSNSNIFFRAFMFETETRRFSQVIWVMQEMLFKRFDQRLASYLISEHEKSGERNLKLTQEEIARDVNSAREVVARMLRHFVSEGLVEVSRGHFM